MADFNDPFDSWDDWDDNVETPKKRGRSSTRRVTTKGPNGRPRVRPLQDKYSRRGRPRLNSKSIADKIEKEALVSGTYFDKSIATSFKTFEKTVSLFQKRVVDPLAKTVSSFASNMQKFNAYHQQYLKDQIAISNEWHETFRLIRKTSIDPLIKNAARWNKRIDDFYDILVEVRENNQTSKDFRKFVNRVNRVDDGLKSAIKNSVLAVESTDDFLKEYHKTSKSTSKFLNSVTYAVEDVSEDIAALRDNLAKYFKGKHNNSILEDQSEALKKIEKNTAAPSIGKRMISMLLTGVVAAGKTVIKYNRYGVTQLLKELYDYKERPQEWQSAYRGMKAKQKEVKRRQAQGEDIPDYEIPFVKRITKVIEDAWDIAIRRKVRDAKGNLRYTYEMASVGAYGSGAQTVAEGVGAVGRSIEPIVSGIRKAWNQSTVKTWSKYFWAVGQGYLERAWDRYGAQGQRSLRATITNYYSKEGIPHPGAQPKTAREAIDKVIDDIESGRYGTLGGNNVYPFPDNRGGFSFRTYGSSALDDSDISDSGYSFPKGNVVNIFDRKRKKQKTKIQFAKGGAGSWFTKDKETMKALWGRGSGIISFESKSESDINQADVSTPKKAMGSLAKLQARAVGYLKKIWQKTKDSTQSVQEKGKGLLDNLLGSGGGLLGGAAGLFAGTKLGQIFKGLGAGLKGKAGLAALTAAGLSGLSLKSAKVGSTARVLWDIFGFGSTKSKGHMTAMSVFKNTKLAASPIGNFIRRANIASQMGKDWGSRLLAGAIDANKWGGIKDPIGWIAGGLKGLGFKYSREKGKLPKIEFKRRGISKLGGEAAKGGTRLKNMWDSIKEAEKAKKAAEFAAKNPELAKYLGTGKAAHIVAGVSNLVGGTIGTVGNIAKGGVKGVWDLAKTTSKGLLSKGVAAGKVLAKFPSKDKFLGALAGGIGVKALTKIGAKGLAKTLAKQIPFLGSLVGIYFGIKKFQKGDVLGGILEIVSGLLTLVPSGAGNLAALGIDAFLIGRDVKKAVDKKKEDNKEKLEKEKVTEAFGLGPNPSAKQVIDAGKVAAENAQRSETNYVSNGQKVEAERKQNRNYISSDNPYITLTDKPINKSGNKPENKGNNLWNKVKGWGKEFLFGKPASAEEIPSNAPTNTVPPNKPKITLANDPASAGSKDNRYAGTDRGINWNGRKHNKLMPRFKKLLFSAADEFYRNTGKKITITDAIRTDEEQANLWYRKHYLGDRNIFTPAQPVNDYVINGKRVPGTHNNNRSGHLVGGAVDIANWSEFRPYAAKYGIKWQGAKDPVHFQINDRGPVITNAAAKPIANNTTPQPNQQKVGDGDPYLATPQPYTSLNSGTDTAKGRNNIQTEISPMIQDYGLAIINSLIFS